MIRGITKKEEQDCQTKKAVEKELHNYKQKIGQLKEEAKGTKCRLHKDMIEADLANLTSSSLNNCVINQAYLDKLKTEFDAKE